MAKSGTPTPNQKTNKLNPLWWLVGMVALILCILIQMPISWIMQKVAPNNPYIQWTSGNLWQGTANWQLPNSQNVGGSITGALSWQWKPWYLATGKYTADLQITTDDSKLNGNFAVGLLGGKENLGKNWQTKELTGQIGNITLGKLVPWQPIPEAPIKVENTNITFKKDTGYQNVSGKLNWAGGNLGYAEGNKKYQIALPTMQAELTDKDNVLQMQIVNDGQKRLGQLTLDKEAMLDISLTQRLLENMPSYKGSAPKDTPVVSLRQPLKASLGGQ